MPAQRSETDVVEHSLRIDARQETVFGYFTDAARMVQWMGAEATLDPRPGGVFRLSFEPPRAVGEYLHTAFGVADAGPAPPIGNRHPHVVLGEYVELEPYDRVVFTWGFELELFALPPQSTVVEVVLTADGEGTLLRLTHRRLPDAAKPVHRAGWEHYLPRLAVVTAGGDPGPDSWQNREGGA